MGLSSSKQGDSPPAESAKPTYDTVAVLQEGDPKSPWRHGQVEEAIFLGARVIVKRCGRTGGHCSGGHRAGAPPSFESDDPFADSERCAGPGLHVSEGVGSVSVNAFQVDVD